MGAQASMLLKHGYLKLKLKATDVNVVLDVFEEADSFFSQETVKKMDYSLNGDVEGYRKLGAEFSVSKNRPDLNEAFGLISGNIKETTRKGWHNSNKLHAALLKVLDIYVPKINSLFEELRVELAPQGDILESSAASYLQVNYYRPSEEQRDFLQDPHEDGHLVTMVKAIEPGLEIEINGRFESLTLADDEILIMPGSLLSIMTGGRVKPLLHRVRNSKLDKNRTSMMFFVNPDIKNPPEPWFTNAEGKKPDLAVACKETSTAFGLPSIEKSV